MINVEQTIISQYANSATISQLVRNMNTYLDPRADFDTFFDFVWNVDTAQGFGLDIWGRIVNIRRELARTLNLRNTPEIRFVLDQSIEYGVNMSKKIDEVTKDLKTEGVEEDAE